jgi:filamentous hemagglutinin
LFLINSIATANLSADNEIQVKGSNLAVGGHLQLDAKDINLLAGENSSTSSSDSSSHTESASVAIKAPDAGGAAFSGSLRATETASESEENYYTNTQIVAGTLSSDSENLTLSGANLDAGVVDISTQNLLVESLQNTSSSQSKTQGANVGFGEEGISSVGANLQESESSSAWVDQQSGITGGNVNITAKDTTLKGGVIAAVDQDGNDNGKLTLTTNTLLVENIQDHDTSSDKGISLSHSFDGTDAHQENNPPKDSSDKMSTASTTMGANYNGHDTRQTTKATLGSGNVTVGSYRDTHDKPFVPS